MLKNFFIVIIGVALDYISKFLVVGGLIYHQALPLFDAKYFGLNLFLTYNSGIAFGLFNTPDSYYNLIFLGLTIIAISSIIYLLVTNKNSDKLEKFSMLLILAGALGNLTDRIIYGYVIDFIDFYIMFNNKYLHWYTFNLADSFICIGVGLLLYKNFYRVT